jgi:diguanylate cyclase (GGDEF)-like protein
MVVTVAKAVLGVDGKIIGVAGFDILLENLKEIVAEANISESGYTFIIDRNGMFVVHPYMEQEDFKPTVDETDMNSGLGAGYRRMMSGEEGFFEGSVDDKWFFMTYAPIPMAGWSLGIVINDDELLAPLKPLLKKMDDYMDEANARITHMSARANIVLLVSIVIVILLVTLLSTSLTRIISKPIQELTKDVVKISEGNFDYRIQVRSRDEIGVLAESFNNMTDSLYNYAQDIITLNLEKSKLETSANTDALTGIYNRRYFMEKAAKMFTSAKKSNIDAYIVLFDLDRFKQINDTYGHPAGDKVLKEVAAILRQSFRPNDLTARFGGEEFILFLVKLTRGNVAELIERVRLNICKQPVVFEGAEIPISASFGIASIRQAKDLDSAVSFADQALYKAKDEGRNKVVFYEG